MSLVPGGWRRRTVFFPAIYLIAGCSSSTLAKRENEDTHAPQWSGRVSVSGTDAGRGAYSAVFVLSGNAAQGRLDLSTALGVTLAQVQWDGEGARVRAQGQNQHYPDMSSLTAALTGTALPLAALFAWLRGEPVQEDGWLPDLSDWAQGRLRAQRLEPAAQLRLVLDEPPGR